MQRNWLSMRKALLLDKIKTNKTCGSHGYQDREHIDEAGQFLS